MKFDPGASLPITPTFVVRSSTIKDNLANATSIIMDSTGSNIFVGGIILKDSNTYTSLTSLSASDGSINWNLGYNSGSDYFGLNNID